MNQVCHNQDSRTTPVNFKPHRPRSPGLGEQSSPAPPQWRYGSVRIVNPFIQPCWARVGGLTLWI